jgi:hypothetical protein
MTRSLVIALTLACSTLQAQQHPLVGTWQVSFVAGMSIENGVETPILGGGHLTIEVQGDSLIGTLNRDPVPGIADRPPARLAGVAADGAVTFLSLSTANINMNGMERTAAVTSTWRLQANGDSLEGTVERQIEGFDEMSRPSPVTGTRQTN